MAQPDDVPAVSSNSSQHHAHSPTPSTSSFTTKASETSSTISSTTSQPHFGRRRAFTNASITSDIGSPTLAPPPTYSTVLDMSVTMADSASVTSPSPSMTSLSPNAQQLQYNRMSRAPSFLGRPSQSPLGPRTRFGPRAMSTGPGSVPETPISSTPPPLPLIPPVPPIPPSVSIASSDSSPNTTARDSLFASPTHDPSPQYPGPATDSPAPTEITLPSIGEHDDPPPPHSPPRTAAIVLPPAPTIPPPNPPATPNLPPVPTPASITFSISQNEISASSSPVIQPSSPAPSASPPLQNRPTAKRNGTIKKKISAKPAMLIPTPKLSFEPVTVEFKSLPLEAFLWTLDNAELQKLVSRAIRSSARESFVRLLSLDNLDRAIPEEIDRLEGLKARTQASYRFMTMKRTMLLQALNQSSATGEVKVGEDGLTGGSSFAKQLSETCAECDKALQTIVQTSDQILQLQKLVDVHWASALAIALRKLNKSYAKRTEELTATRERVTNLEDELKEAWDHAAKYAEEMDDMEKDTGFVSDEEPEDEDDVEPREDPEEPAEEITPTPAAAEPAQAQVEDKIQDPSDTESDSELDEAEVAIIEKAEVVALPPSRRASTISDTVLRRGTKASFPPIPPPLPLNMLPEFTPISPMPRLSGIGKSPQSGPGLNIAGSPTTPVASSSRPPSMPPRSPLPPVPPPKDPARYAKHNRRASDAVSIRSTRSTKSVARSVRSTRQSQASALLSPGSRPGSRLDSRPNSSMTDSASLTGQSRLSQVSAAKARSHRASKGSLRIPRTPGSSYLDQPPVPDLPPEFLAAASAMNTPSTSALINNTTLAIADDEEPAKEDILSTEGKISRIRRTSLDMGSWIGVKRAKTLGASRAAGDGLLGSNEEAKKPSRTVDDIDFRPIFVGEIQRPKKPSRPVPAVPDELAQEEMAEEMAEEWLSTDEAAAAIRQQMGQNAAPRDSNLSFSRYFHRVARSFDTEDVLDLDLNLSLPDGQSQADEEEEGEELEEEEEEIEEEEEEEEEYDEFPASATEESAANAILATDSSPLSHFTEYSYSGYAQSPDDLAQEITLIPADATLADSVDKSLPPTPQAHARKPSTGSANFNPNVTDPRILSALSKLPLGRNTSLRGRPLMKKRYSLHLPIFKNRVSVVPKVGDIKSKKNEDVGVTSEPESSAASTSTSASTSLGIKMGISKSALGSVRSLPGRLTGHGGGSSSSVS